MTVLSALGDAASLVISDALTSVNRRLSARRAGPYGSNPMVLPVPENQPVQLAGNRLITYADSVASYPVVFAVWSKILRSLATTDVGVYEERDDGPPERVWGTDLEALLRRPAPGKGLVDLLQWLFNPYLVEGNGLVAKYRAGGPESPPTNLIPLDWRYMSALAVPGGPVEQWISFQIGDPRPLDPSEVVHLAWDSPTGGAIGTSALRALGVSIRLDDGAARHQIASLDNAVRPSGALVLPKEARTTPEERAEMREQVETQHAGVDDRFRFLVLSGGIEWRPMSFSAAEAELDSTRKRSMDEVCIAYDVRRSVIAEPDRVTGGRYGEILRDFQRTLQVHTRLAENVLQRQLIDPEPAWAERRLCVRFDLSDLVRGTYAEELEAASHAYVNGLTALDESRQRVGLKPIGDEESKRPRTPYAQLQPARDGRALPPATT